MSEHITALQNSYLLAIPIRPIVIENKDVNYHSYDEFTLTPHGCPYMADFVVELSHEDFLNFVNDLTREWNFISEQVECFFIDSENCQHGILVLGKDWKGGYIFDPAGTNSAVYRAFVPRARRLYETDCYPPF